MEIGAIALGKEWKVKQQAVSSLMNNAKSSSAVAWVMMNEENYGLSNIPAWVTSLSPPKNEVPPAERGVQTKNIDERGEQTENDSPESQDKRTLFTREQLIEMGRIIEGDDRKERDTGEENVDPSKLSGDDRKARPRSLYNQPLSAFKQPEPSVVTTRV